MKILILIIGVLSINAFGAERKRVTSEYTHREFYKVFKKQSAKKRALANVGVAALQDCQAKGKLECRLESEPSPGECVFERGMYQQNPNNMGWLKKRLAFHKNWRYCTASIFVSAYPSAQQQAEIERLEQEKERNKLEYIKQTQGND